MVIHSVTKIILISCFAQVITGSQNNVYVVCIPKHLVPLSVRHSVSKVTFLYKCVCNLTFVRNDILLHRVSGSHRLHNLQLILSF